MNPISPVFFLSGEEVHLYQPLDDIFPGNHIDHISRAEAIKLVLARVDGRRKPRSQASSAN